MVERIGEIGERHELLMAVFGHAGDGNLHVNLLSDDPDPEDVQARFRAARVDLFHAALHLGGTLSGEHGIGLSKRDYMILEHAPQELEMMRSIKKLWDPLGLLNPGKLLPDPY
jgi:glycolate oxidase